MNRGAVFFRGPTLCELLARGDIMHGYVITVENSRVIGVSEPLHSIAAVRRYLARHGWTDTGPIKVASQLRLPKEETSFDRFERALKTFDDVRPKDLFAFLQPGAVQAAFAAIAVMGVQPQAA